MKMNRLYIVTALLALMTACSSEENIENSKQHIEVGGDKLKIVIYEEQFDAETTAQTRAGEADQAIPAGTIDLGDGLEAEVSISQGAVASTRSSGTRATIVSDGHYNIYAYDAATNKMLTGPDKKLSGNMVGGIFTRDPGTCLDLEPGNYKFVCCTDEVNLDPTNFEHAGLDWGMNLKRTMIGATEEIEVKSSPISQSIIFLMHHRTSRLRFRLTSYTNQLTNVKVGIGFAGQSYPYYQMRVPTGFYGPGDATLDLGSGLHIVHSTPTQQSATYPLANDFVSDYQYLSWTSFASSTVSLYLYGTIYGKTVNIQGNKWLSFAHAINWHDNGTYTINLKLTPTPALYLFQDGSCGALAEKGSRTPIGVVAREKTKTTHGIAVALKDADNNTSQYTTPYNMAKMNTQHNTTHYTDANDAVNDLDGYKWTYEAAGSVDGRIKANEATDYTPFYKAANYNPGVTVTGSNIGKWYVPAFGEWCLAWKAFGRWDGNLTPLNVYVQDNSQHRGMNDAFIAAGGKSLNSYEYWNSTEYEGAMRPALAVSWAVWGTSFFLGRNATHNLNGYVRPFVHF